MDFRARPVIVCEEENPGACGTDFEERMGAWVGWLYAVLAESRMREHRWQLPQLPPGMYTVVVRSGQNVAARQFVVTR
jgi:hypothetical protein